MRPSSCTRSTRTRTAPRSTSTACWRSASAPPQPPEGRATRATALIAAAGSGERLGAGGPKALVEVAGRPLVAWSVAAFARAPSVGAIVAAAPGGYEDELEAAIADSAGGAVKVEVVTGGAARAESVARGLARVETEFVAVHDAARPLITAELIEGLIARAAEPSVDGAIAAARVTDTIKRVRGEEAVITATEDRSALWAAQTPQVFRTTELRAAHEHGPVAEATDDAMVVEARGGRVVVEDAGAANLKVTTSTDLRLAALLLAER